ncbi:MAG: 4'-phosphopantetheinyl transferase superfamily protein [Alphaproteobacteria bacterium]|nr:4'-phosphopantetheinyl transferase superfamily protein [Alphaproteobacteria bacterium]
MDAPSMGGLNWSQMPRAQSAYPAPDEVHLRLIRLPQGGDRVRRVAAQRQSLLRSLGHAIGQSLCAEDLLRLPGGKPILLPSTDRSALSFSLSHSHDLMLIGVAARSGLGVDVERVRAVPQAALIAQRFFSADEQEMLSALLGEARDIAFLKIWTLYEAVLKRDGVGLRHLARARRSDPPPSLTTLRLGARFVAGIAAPHGMRLMRAKQLASMPCARDRNPILAARPTVASATSWKAS